MSFEPINASSPTGPPLDLRTVPRELLGGDAGSGVNPSMRNNPFFPEVRYNPQAYDPSEWNRQRQASSSFRPVNSSLPGGSNYNPSAYNPSEYLRQQAGVSVDEWAKRQPQAVNSGPATVTAPRTPNPGQQINPRAPRVPRPSPGSLLQGGVSLGIGIAGEAAIDAAWDKVAPDREERYKERTQDPRPLRPNYPEISGGIGAIGAGPIGVAGAAAAAAGRYLFPDDSDIGNPNGVLGRSLGWNDEYPNQTDPDSIPPGPVVDSGSPGDIAAGSVAGVAYRITWTVTAYSGPVDGSGTWAPSTQSVNAVGPISKSSSGEAVTYSWPGGSQTFYTSFFNPFYGFNTVVNGSGSISRLDGGTDPTVGATPPTYAPNPARSRPRPTVPGGVPNLLPDPPINAPGYDPGSDTPWPGVEPTTPPDTQPIAPAPDAPPGFQPSAPAGAPNTPTNPNAPPGPPDLDPNAPPRDAPNLADDPDTPTQPVGSPGGSFGGAHGSAPQEWPKITKLPDGTEIIDQENGDRQIIWPPGTSHEDAISKLNPPVLPVPVPVGTAQPANTPSPPNLVPRTPTNPNVQQVQQPVRQTPTEAPKGTCFYEFQRVADIQRKATDTNQRAGNPVSGFPGLYGIGIESRVKLGETFTLLQTVNEFMRKAWRATRMDKVLNLLTFIGVMHNVSMLSRDVGETFFQLISQALQAVGIRDEEDNVIDVGEVVGNTVENFLKTILGESTYNGINEAWNKANRIISSASAVIWVVRSIADSSLDLMEWIGENTGKIGNALKRWGVVGERDYPWMSESARAQNRFRRRFQKVTDALETAEDGLSNAMIATSTTIEIQDETQELRESWQRFQDSVVNGIPDPWLDNAALKAPADEVKAAAENIPDVPPADAQKG